MENQMELWFLAKPENEALARMTIAGFMMTVNPTLDEIADVKTAVSEAVTNAIIHGYPKEVEKYRDEKIFMGCYLTGEELRIVIEDRGIGIADIAKALTPLYTTRPDLERSGMGFSFMDAFMDGMEVESKPQVGTRITLVKYFPRRKEATGAK